MFTAKISRVFQSREICCSCRWKKGQWVDNKDYDINRNKEIEKKNPDKVVLMIELSDIITIRLLRNL